ncbi:hypothetical protein [Chromatium okenii]|jgi:hypothetical protein|uniref:hypothetical protein n=1 Tax=Chromatium okenii TaxID=61644 RepID=UPI0026EF9ED3|nr:hypothetical protein [Chromatium okenii]MBV5308508.1 hypothetical protein [Chromatium okenii]
MLDQELIELYREKRTSRSGYLVPAHIALEYARFSIAISPIADDLDENFDADVWLKEQCVDCAYTHDCQSCVFGQYQNRGVSLKKQPL